jgi:predicted DNA-binding transcriptional regulator YafY
MAKIRAVLPPDLGIEAETSGLVVAPAAPPPAAFDFAALRDAIRRERKVTLTYEDAMARASTRTIWPFALGYFDRVHMIAAWCEERGDFRHFRLDRIRAIEVEDLRYPRRRAVLLKEWRLKEGVAPQ